MTYSDNRLFRHRSSGKNELASCIRVEEGQIFFNLNEEALRRIHQAKKKKTPLELPFRLQLFLLRHVLLYIEVISHKEIKKPKIYLMPGLTSGLTFYTRYSNQASVSERKNLLRSRISPDGDLLFQISSHSLQHPYFSEISTAHHWLTTQLLKHLYTKLNRIPRLILIVFTAIYVVSLRGDSCLLIAIKILFFPIFLFLARIMWRLIQPAIIKLAFRLISRKLSIQI